MSSPIAIVGMGCRFGGAPDLQAYWRLTRDGQDAFRTIPADRFDADVYFDANRRSTDKMYTRIGAFLEDIRTFPGLAFGIPPRRLEVMDPQHRFALEVCLQAIEDAGTEARGLPRRTGVFIGATMFEYRTVLAARVLAQSIAAGQFGTVRDPDEILRAVERIVPSRPYTAPGALGNMIAATVAQELDLHGPAYTVDAACASALVAVADAVSALRAGTLDAALAGGVYVCITPETFVGFCRIGAMSERGKCLPFDARADGFVQGDGAGAVLLKRLDDAVRDGDRVYAVLHGVASNNDGRGDGPMAPQKDGQAEVIAAAWGDAGLDASGLGYHETHGTGTEVGDVTEMKGLRQALGSRVYGVALGSAKANVGHTESAAGVAGLIRATLAIHHATIPPMANFTTPKAGLGLEQGAFRVPTAAEAWPGARFASVSSFGFGGTNVHAVLGQAPARPPVVPAAELVLLSACDEPSLRALAGRTAAAVLADPSVSPAGATPNSGWIIAALRSRMRCWGTRRQGGTRSSRPLRP
jgi:acyl transferase domain-containing protein